MEGIANFKKWIREMRSELIQQVDKSRRLAVAFTETDTQLVRYDQVVRLEVLKSRINKEVEDKGGLKQQHKPGIPKAQCLIVD